MESDFTAVRLARVRDAMRGSALDALIVTHLPNVRYLTGFSGTAGILLVAEELAILFSDSRYEVQAQEEVTDLIRIEIVARDALGATLRALQDAGGVKRVGYEAESITAHDAERLTPDGGDGPSFQATEQMVEAFRAEKGDEEIAAIKAAATLASEAVEAVLRTVRPGQSELIIAAALERELRVRGSEWHPFPTIVASGPRSALPHAHTTDRVVQSGDLLLLDFGAQVDGYCADITRTVVVGGPSDERQRHVYGVVREAQARAITGMRPGMTGCEIDALARSVIDAAGFGEAFGHSLGHGLGLEVHEGPSVSRSNEKSVPERAVVTVEPGIYLPTWGGVRIEDDVVMTANGALVLSDGRTELRVVG